MPYEGPWVFRVPYGNDAALENFQNTVIDGVTVEQARRFADDPPATDGVLRLWGTQPSNDGKWAKLNAGDYLVFYRDGTYTHSAEVLRTERNDALAREVWPNFEEDPWDRIMYLAPPTEIDLSAAEVHELAGYDREYVLGFNRFNEMGIGGIRGRYGSVEAFAEGETSDGGTADVDVDRVPEFSFDSDVLDGLHFPDNRGEEILEQVESAFQAGKHVVFTGPPGTGKTEVARKICTALVDAHDDVYTGSQITTATADWSTFETVGGYMPTEEIDDGNLVFEPGQVLRRFKRDGVQHNELLVIDEINRADIDKAFGQLFTLLSGQSVQLPYRRAGEEIVIEPASRFDGTPAAHEYVMPESWRLVATMNTYDKTSLYELSYAFMRRFAFVHVDVPTVPEDDAARSALLREYTSEWGIDPRPETIDAVSEIWSVMNNGQGDRKIGPAIVRDMIRGIEHGTHRNHEISVTAAVGNYVLPQLEGARHREDIVRRLSNVSAVDRHRLSDLSKDVLQL